MSQAISAKIVKLIGQFNGEASTEQFLGRVQVAAEMFGEEETAAAMPFVLDGRAFNVLTAMTSDGRKKLDLVTKRLREVFGLTPIEAVTKLKDRNLRPDEPANELMNHLRQQIESMKLGNQDAEGKLLRLMFIACLPVGVKSEL